MYVGQIGAAMKIYVSFCFGILLCALASRAQSVRGATSFAITGPDLLMRVRVANELLYSDLKNVVCNEQIDRYRGTLTGTEGRLIDSIQSKVSFENGAEHYIEIRRNNESALRICRASLARGQKVNSEHCCVRRKLSWAPSRSCFGWTPS